MKILNWCKAEEESICIQEGRKEGERLGVWEYWATKHLCQIKANPYLWEKDSVIPWAVFPPLKGRFLSPSLSALLAHFSMELGEIFCTFSQLWLSVEKLGQLGSAEWGGGGIEGLASRLSWRGSFASGGAGAEGRGGRRGGRVEDADYRH